MKKLFAFLLVLVLILTFVGCEEVREELFGDYEEDDELYMEEPASEQNGWTNWQQPVQQPAEAEDPFRIKDDNGPLHDGVVKYVGNKMYFTVDVPAEAEARYITVSSSDESVVTFIYIIPYENETSVCLDFCGAGKAQLTLALEGSDISRTYDITVKEDYECNPGPGELTPEEFVYCVTEVAKANGMTLMSSTPKCYANVALEDYKLTWENARSMAETNCRQWWHEGYRYINFIYRGVYPAGNMFRAYLSA